MKFLFDENVSYRIVRKIIDLAPGSIHVTNSGLSKPAKDREIWDFAKKNNFIIVSFDEDFQDLVNFYGFPPKVILLRTGNSSTGYISDLLISRFSDIQEFYKSNIYGLLEIF